MKYVELAYNSNGIFHRNNYVEYKSPEYYNFLKQAEDSRNPLGDFYTSAYVYEWHGSASTLIENLDLVKKTGDFYIDLDSTDKVLVEKDMMKLSEYLEAQLVPFEVWDSGNKGYHFYVDQYHIALPDPINVNKYYKQIAEHLAETLHLTTLDKVVYDNRRLFRVRNSWNSKGGRVKKLLRKEEAKAFTASLDVPAMKAVTSQPAPVREQYQTSVIKKTIEPFMLRLINREPSDGKRMNTAYTIALYLKDHGYTSDETVSILLNSPNTLTPQEKMSAVESAYGGSKHFGLTDNEIVYNIMTEDEKVQHNQDDVTSLLVSWDKVMDNTKDQLEKFKKKELLSYGIETLDNYLGMIQPTELVTVGGVSGIGKSEFVWNIAKANAKLGIPVAFIGLEMTPEQYALRTIRNRVGMDSNKFKTMDMTEEEKASVNSTIEAMRGEDLPIYFFNPKFKLDINRLEKLVEAATEKFGIKLWVIDHLHYFPMSTGKDDQTEAIASIVTSIKQLTLKHELPIVLVSHYRKINSGTSPSLNSFKDSITIAQVSDTVLALNRDLVTADVGLQRRVEISVLKSRYGMPSAHFYANFNPKSGEYAASTDFSYGLKGTQFD